jgi:tetratricopeptide (TPR) repeat protein
MARKVHQFALRLALLLSLGAPLAAQTFQIDQPSQPPPKHGKKKQTPSPTAKPSPSSGSTIGWGSGIEVARDARAAQEALDRGDYNSAVAYAARAAKAAPQDTAMWFSLGYAARLAGQYQVSLDAYKRGLQNTPSSITGLSGMAQTYAKMGRESDAQEVLKQVLAANPKSVVDLELAGELALNSDPGTALGLLQRADQLQPSARGELLIARAYQRLNKPDQSKQWLERAENRAPNDPAVLRSVAAFYRDARQYDVAIATLKKAGASKDPQVLPELAYTYQLAGKKKEAAQAYSEAANHRPKDTGLQLSAAQALVNIGSFDTADSFLKRAGEQQPDNYRLHAIRGQMDSMQNLTDDAIREYQEAIKNMPQGVPEGPLYPVQLHLSLAELYRAADNSQAADAEVATARNLIGAVTGFDQTNQPEFLRLRGLIESASNDDAAAERDFKAALAIDPQNVAVMLNYANLLWKLDRKQDAYDLYSKAIAIEPGNSGGLTALGYLARDLGQPRTAEKYFLKLASLYPRDYVAYLALGDLYTALKDYPRAQVNYDKAHEIAPNNPLVVAGGINSALEAHTLPVARRWLDRIAGNAAINQSPQVMREHERYLTFTGNYAESAQLGYQVIQKLPRDPEAPVYLAYDLLFLNRYKDAFDIVQKYEPILPKDKDLRLIAGYVHAHYRQLRDAADDFGNAIALDPKVATGYMNRGFVLNDMRQPDRAAHDFETAIQIRPDYGEAYLGLAYSNLQLRRPKPALKNADAAAKLSGESKATHLARAEAYRQQVKLRKAENEYREALKFAPNDVPTRLALADALYRERQYDQAIKELQAALGKQPEDDGLVYADIARSYAQLKEDAQARQAITAAEQHSTDSKVLMATGEAFLIMGDNRAAMERYGHALTSPGSDRVQTRLALARLFAQEGRDSDAEQQISLGFAEARVSDTDSVDAADLLDAAGVLMSIHQYELAKQYFMRAESAGAGEEAVGIGLANAYLALGETHSAGQVLSSFRNDPDSEENYQYLMAMSNVYRQQQDTVQALTEVARANQLVDGDDYAQRTELSLAEQEGRQVTDNVSVRPDASFAPIFEDITIYQTDAKLRGITNPALLPPPRSSYESLADARYRIHFKGWPVISGLVEERNARGSISIPSELLIVNRNTFDTTFNGGINPVWHFGNNSLAFEPGLQFTVRRDTSDPVNINQNLFRQFLYVYSSPFFNWVSFSGTLIRETGPFTEQDLHSRDASAHLDFVVGRPWGKTSLITGYSARDVLFRPLIREYFTTDSYLGVRHRFGDHVKASIIGEYLRSWRVQDNLYAIAQAIRPGFNVEVTPNMHWTITAAGVWSRGEGDHFYDNVGNQLLVSYVRSVQRPLHDGLGEVPVNYPLRFSFGIQQQTFYNFTGSSTTTVLPVVRLSLF